MANPVESGEKSLRADDRRFVLLCAPSDSGHASVPDELRAAIASRAAQIVVRTCVYETMADLVQNEQAFRAEGSKVALVLVVIEPSDIAHAADLVDAACRYTPSAVCWRYSMGTEPRLAAFIDSPRPGPQESAPIHVEPGAPGPIRPRPVLSSDKPQLRLTGDPPEISSNQGPDDSPEEPQRPLLSEEELEMLLSDDWERQTGEGGPT